jgi:hypothetical protein
VVASAWMRMRVLRQLRITESNRWRGETITCSVGLRDPAGCYAWRLNGLPCAAPGQTCVVTSRRQSRLRQRHLLARARSHGHRPSGRGPVADPRG